jgi:hypothetical protein
LKTNAKTTTATEVKVQDAQDDALKSILKEDYVTFVRNLGENIKDPKFRAAIRSLSSENKVSSKYLNVTVSNLIPTQNEIDVDKSLKYALTSANSTRSYLYCTEPIKILNNYIVTSADGKYVIDGHHRWSQVYSINPDCRMASMDLTQIKDPINALKSTQLGIAAGVDKNGYEISEIPVAIVEGKNLLKISEADLKAYVVKTITQEVLDVFTQSNASIKTKEDAANYIWKNVNMMQKNNQPIPGAPARGFMPQTDMAVNWVVNTVNTDKVLSSNYVLTNFFAIACLLFFALF